MSKVGHLCQIYQNHSPNMVMSRDSGLKFQKFLYFLPKSVLNFKKSYQIWGNWLKKKKLQAKNKLGVDNPPSAYWVKCHHFTC